MVGLLTNNKSSKEQKTIMVGWRSNTAGSSRTTGKLSDISKVDILRQFVTEKLSSATEEILAVLQRTVLGYEEESRGYRREIQRQQELLECLLQPRVKLERVENVTEVQEFEIVDEGFDGDERQTHQVETDNVTELDDQEFEIVDEGFDGEDGPIHKVKTDVKEDDLGFIWYTDKNKLFDEDTLAPETTSYKRRREDLKDPDFEISERISTPNVPSVQSPVEPRVREVKDGIVLRVHVLDSTSSVSPKSDPVQLVCPTGLQEVEFLQLLYATFPHLTADQELNMYVAQQGGKRKPLKVTSLTPEEIERNMSAVNNPTLYIKLENKDSWQAEGEAEPTCSSALQTQTRSRSLSGRRKTRPERSPHTHFSFRFCVLEKTEKPSENGFQKSAVQLLQCPCNMNEAEFMDLLKSSFPQLAGDDKHFEIQMLDKQQCLQKLQLKTLKPDQINGAIRSSQGKEEVLYIKLKNEDDQSAEEETEQLCISPLQTEKPSRSSLAKKRRCPKPPHTHFSFTFSVLEDGQTDKPSEDGFQNSALQLLQCPCHMNEAEFMDLLKSSFPQLAGDDKHFEIHKLDKQQCLQKLQLKTLKPDKIHEAIGSSQGKEEVLYIRLKTGDAKDVEEDGEKENAEKSKRKNRGSIYSRYLEDAAEFEESQEDQQLDFMPPKAKQKKSIDMLHQCKVCGVRYRRRSSLIKHAWTHLKELNNSCGICGENFKSTVEQTLHMESHQKPYFCDVCGKAFVEKKALQIHSHQHSDQLPFKCDVCHKGFITLKRMKVHCSTHVAEKHQCDLSLRKLSLKGELKFHHKQHSRKVESQCLICMKVFFDKRTLMLHRLTHFKERQYGCDICGKHFKLPSTLKSHKKTHTEQERTFMCHICPKTFAERPGLNSHMNVHSEERPFVCPICSRNFTTNALLKSHQVRHSNERRFVCSDCGMRFKRKVDLKKHMRTHGEVVKQFVCDVCGKVCGRKDHLIVHMRIHNGERPFECDLCDKAFTQSHCLKTHMKTHKTDQVKGNEGNVLPDSTKTILATYNPDICDEVVTG